jgi:drug/metabolite transporter (DMT)-like permease
VLIVGTGVLLLSPDALWLRLLSMNGWSIVFWRGVCTSFGYLVVARATARMSTAGPRASARSRLAISALAAVGNMCFVGAITHTTAAQTLVILASSPLLSALMTQASGLERVARRTWLTTAIVLPCIAVIVVRPGEVSLSAGDVYALAGAIALAALLVVVRHSGEADVVPSLVLGGVLTAAVAAPFTDVLSLTGSDVLILLAGFVIMLPLSLTLIMRGPRYLTAPEVGLVLLLETVLGPVWVWLAVGEQPTSRVSLAGVVIVVTLACSSLSALRQAR